MGNAYAQIIRDSSGDLVSLWPLSPDQTEVFVDSKGQVAYKYQKDGKTYRNTSTYVEKIVLVIQVVSLSRKHLHIRGENP